MAMIPMQKAEDEYATTTTANIFSSTTSYFRANSASLSKYGKTQTLSFIADGIPNATWCNIGVLKEEFRPAADISFPALASSSSEARLWIQADGTVKVYNSSGSLANLNCTATFLCA